MTLDAWLLSHVDSVADDCVRPWAKTSHEPMACSRRMGSCILSGHHFRWSINGCQCVHDCIRENVITVDDGNMVLITGAQNVLAYESTAVLQLIPN